MADSNKSKYTVVGPILMDGKLYQQGDIIELTKKQASEIGREVRQQD